jgi:hypothetical protein
MSGAQRNLNAQGRTRSEVSAVIVSIGTPKDRSSVGRVHQINPIGAPSDIYRNVKRIVRLRGVERKFKRLISGMHWKKIYSV